MPQRTVTAVTGMSSATVIDWNSFARLIQAKLMGTSDVPVEVEKSYVCGWRKYGKGRLVAGGRVVSSETEPQNYDSELLGWNETTPDNEDDVDSKVDFVR